MHARKRRELKETQYERSTEAELRPISPDNIQNDTGTSDIARRRDSWATHRRRVLIPYAKDLSIGYRQDSQVAVTVGNIDHLDG